ncbi:hypothetical protein [uncultured Megasphaera sp.]|uniref:hypothetical protein n=1 Tax=uncultured Megasphaera sp. TaxID=165188 RepID=UPI00265A393D|nr:hypothetical protein [uncultured Megasphaera sp.]
METKVSTLKAIAPLQLAFPNSLTKDRVRLYVEHLADIDPQILSNTVSKIIRTEERMPSIAVIRNMAQQAIEIASGTQQMDADEAWGMVQRKIMSIGQYCKPTFEDDVLTETVDHLGWIEICQTPVEQTATLRAQFRKAFEQCRERHTERRHWEQVGILPPQQAERKKLANETIAMLAGEKAM